MFGTELDSFQKVTFTILVTTSVVVGVSLAIINFVPYVFLFRLSTEPSPTKTSPVFGRTAEWPWAIIRDRCRGGCRRIHGSGRPKSLLILNRLTMTIVTIPGPRYYLQLHPITTITCPFACSHCVKRLYVFVCVCVIVFIKNW